jgi:hypothetical protein
MGLPTMLRRAQHDTHFKHIVTLSDSEGSSSKSMAAIQGEEDASYLSMTKGQIA